MLRKQVKPLELDMRKDKKKDYKSVVADIQNEGQEFDAQRIKFYVCAVIVKTGYWCAKRVAYARLKC